MAILQLYGNSKERTADNFSFFPHKKKQVKQRTKGVVVVLVVFFPDQKTTIPPLFGGG